MFNKKFRNSKFVQKYENLATYIAEKTKKDNILIYDVVRENLMDKIKEKYKEKQRKKDRERYKQAGEGDGKDYM